ncbi:DUF3833 domain-containing protein [Pseudoalteromonas sp. SG45-5]|jgi:hypothetical protein|uniref:DUF3833 domain-containing protein n=1 Tax=unclassified Pseudoalteromonas TaxID=194690 RepID=UPI00110A7E2B|nr:MULTISPECIES: DUF3833 domain-containing protein [unclassified Pseudoalteromonas]MBB1386834.1 DUF3833 domain-containing protein [Pseudoalteromonas sp. SG45-5]MBB1394903.1 DUF3833 domain-containing protein [Pseudoalteromonas sp. SG44-4]MBB1449037.1 DUF3833 domain-containing protein [Pseudoalteromonas sp. SG41-6]TMN96972.1 DUF3833 domain-containing protein [Pseudoalteromonas sp. S558]
MNVSNMLKLVAVSLLAFLLVSCSAPNVEHYKNTSPNFDFKTFFNGNLKAYGVVQDFKGELTRKLVVDMKATWDGSEGVIEEDFIYDDGQTQKRIWKITLNDDNSLTGTADDVLGIAKGKSQGSVFHWNYNVELPYDGSTLEVNFDDWMYLVTQTRLINRTSIVKFGVEVGEVTLVIEKI